MFGLSQKSIEEINGCFAKHEGIDLVIVYGSRAIGNYKPGSDIDLAIKGQLSISELLQLESELDDLLLPYTIDISLIDLINEPALINHVERVGKIFYNRLTPVQLNEDPVPYIKSINK